MNRFEFMSQLSAMLTDITVEDRQDALTYYEDYFDEAGVEREQEVIMELGSPAQVAATIKANLNGFDSTKKDDMPQVTHSNKQGVKNDNNKIMKIILIVLIILVGAPIIIPLAAAIIATVVGLLVAAFGIFISLIVVSISLVIAGVALIVVGILCIVPELAAGIALLGSGMTLTGVGLVATYGMIKLTMLAFPPMFRFAVDLVKRPFQRKAVS